MINDTPFLKPERIYVWKSNKLIWNKLCKDLDWILKRLEMKFEKIWNEFRKDLGWIFKRFGIDLEWISEIFGLKFE